MLVNNSNLTTIWVDENDQQIKIIDQRLLPHKLSIVTLNSVKDDIENIDTKIVYSSIIELENNKINKEDMEKIILVNVPTEIYPELRQTFIFLFEKSGFKDVKINEIVDFNKLYKLKKGQ